MADEHRAVLIGGTSHTGKSTVSRALAERFGWICRPTDKMARHPGRPWQTAPAQVPAHVANHYRTLPVDKLIADVLRHYTDNVWPENAEAFRHGMLTLGGDIHSVGLQVRSLR